MRNKNEGYAEAEFAVEGLVAEHIHSRPCADTASCDGEKKQRGLGNAPPMAACQQFVEAES